MLKVLGEDGAWQNITDYAVAQASAQFSVASGRIDAVVESVDANSKQISEVKETADTVSSTVSELTKDGGRISSVEQRVDSISTTVGDEQSGLVSKVNQTSSELTTYIESNDGAITEVKQDVSGVKSSVGTLQSDMTIVQQKQNSLSTTVTDQDNRLSEVEQTATAISAKVKTYDTVAENLFPTPYYNTKINTSTGYFHTIAPTLIKPTEAGATVSVRLRGRFGRYRLRMFYAYNYKAYVELYGSQHADVLSGKRKADYVGGTDNEVIEYSFTSADTYSDDTNAAIFAVRTIDDADGTIDANCILSHVIVAQTDNITLGTLLKDTGIDIEAGAVTVTADNFKVQNNSGEQTALVDASGKLTVSLIDVVNLAAQRVYGMIAGSNYPICALNADGDGAYVIYYPNTDTTMLRICPADDEGESVIQFFDTDGLELWHIGKSASFVTSGYSWTIIVMADITESEAKSAVNYANTDKAFNVYVYHCEDSSKYAAYNGMYFTDNTSTPDKCTLVAANTILYEANYSGGVPNAQGYEIPKVRWQHTIGSTDGVSTGKKPISVS
jgi:hypothetical protein